MSARRLMICSIAIVIILAMSAPAWGQVPKEIEVGKARTVTLTSEAVIGGVTLAPGEYLVRHFVRGDEHYLSFAKERKADEELVRVACAMKDLPDKARRTEQLYVYNDAGERVLKELTFRGDKNTHVF